ncbi:MAG: alpha/beta hydrolase family protein, partial [Acidimicrobiales bacterium]
MTLAGTLTIPPTAGPHPALVLITGSGPQDRDESLAPLAAIKPFRLIANHVTRNGIAVLRYDDRGAGLSTGDHTAATSADFATDAEAAVDYLLNRDDINPEQIGILGHSEGGAIAPLIAVNNPDVAFIIAMSGTAVRGSDVLLVQNERILSAVGASEERISRQVELLSTLFELAVAQDEDALQEALHELILFQVQNIPEEELEGVDDLEALAEDLTAQQLSTFQSAWYRYFLTYDPAEYWAQVNVPVLALFGALDVQVDAEQNAPPLEAALEQAGNTDFTIVTFLMANHLFQDAVTGSPDEYGTLEQEFLPTFLPTITEWLLDRLDVAQDGDKDITLVPFTSEDFGISGVVPEGWAEAAPGTYARGANATDQTVLIQKSYPGTTLDQINAALLPQLGLEEFPESVGSHESTAFTWDLYTTEVEAPGVGMFMVEIAQFETDAAAYMVLLQALADDYETNSYHEAIFLPTVDALALLSDETADTAVYEDPNGLFSVPIPTNWTAEQADGYAILSSPDNEITLKMLAIEGDDVEEAIKAAWAVVDREFDLEPQGISDRPPPAGIEK